MATTYNPYRSTDPNQKADTSQFTSVTPTATATKTVSSTPTVTSSPTINSNGGVGSVPYGPTYTPTITKATTTSTPTNVITGTNSLTPISGTTVKTYNPTTGSWGTAQVVNGRTMTSGLTPGTVVITGGGNYQITGGVPGAYTSTKYTGTIPTYNGISTITPNINPTVTDPYAMTNLNTEVNPLAQLPQTQEVTRQEIPYQQNVLDLLSQAQEKIASMGQNITSSPYYTSAMNAAQSAANEASQTAMEGINARGILNSTVTADRVGQIQNKAMTEILPAILTQVYGIQQDEVNSLINLAQQYASQGQTEYNAKVAAEKVAYERRIAEQQAQLEAQAQEIENQQAKIEMAIDRVNALGYVDNVASVILGVPVGTKSAEAQKIALQQQTELQKTKLSIANQYKMNQEDNATSRANNAASNATSTYNTNLRINAENDITGGSASKVNPKTSAENLNEAKQKITSYKKMDNATAVAYAKTVKNEFTDSDYKTLLNWISQTY